MDITPYAVKPESYDILSAAQILQFFRQHETITKDECDSYASGLVKSPVSPTPVQGATSYTVVADNVPKVVQFRTHRLDPALMELARKSYGGFVPSYVAQNMFGTAYLYVWDLVRGPAFCRVRRQLLAPGMEKYLENTVKDFARFFASAWVSRPAIEAPPSLFEKYSQLLNTLSQSLPQRFLPSIDRIRQSLPLLFRPQYPVVIQHDDLLENNIHVDEDTGQIVGIVDWQCSTVAPFGVSLWGLETVLGVQTASTWHFHHDHASLRKRFWDAFYELTGEISELDRQSMETARLFGLFREYGSGEKAAAYLDVLCPP